MAEIRVMLKFDYPPPTGPESRHMWMLLNPEHLRTVTDLSDLIRGRYYPNLRGALCLYVHDCLLPPGESARLVRDNDVIRVQWRGFDSEDDDLDGPAHPTKKRSRQRCEEDDAGDRPATRAKKRKCETPRGREEVVLEECEREESPKSSRRKAKKKKKVLEEGAQEEFPEESPKRSKHKKRSEDSASLKSGNPPTPVSAKKPSEIPPKPGNKSNNNPPGRSAEKTSSGDSESSTDQRSSTKPKRLHKSGTVHKAKPNHKLLSEGATKSSSLRDSSESSLDEESSAKPKGPPKVHNKVGTVAAVNQTKPNRKLPAKKSSMSSSGSSSDEESSAQPKGPLKVHPKAGTLVNKTKPNRKLLTEGATKSSSGSSSDEESSAKPKDPPKVHNKAGTVAAVNQTKPNHGLPAKKSSMSSFSDSSGSSSDQESSAKPKGPPKVHNKVGTVVFGNKTNPNVGPSTTSTRSSMDYTASSYDKDPRKNLSEASRNPSDSVPGRTGWKSKNDSASDNGDIRQRMDVGTASPLNGTSQKPHREAPPSGSDSNIQEPVTAQYASRGVPSGVTNGGIHRGPDPNPSLYDHGRGRGRGIVPWRGHGGHGPRGWGERGKGRGVGHQFFHNYDSPSLKKQQLEEDATNTSMIIQNPPESPKKDYSTFPLLAGPPQVGKIIAFKILELDENYSPELSDYKEGVVRSVDPVTQQVELELLAKQKRREPGKFDLVYEMEDGREIVEFAVRPDRKMKESWSSLVTPRLVMDKEFENKGTSAQTL
ncbi:coilin isoform X2 [Rana temporaria]|uniref:coilin isoform X2 n=1 Tax=Rana temporaria TaxID=8407 RepID=UPI001AADC269|nr:coilin isoform X2 [Rana temporaria]